jgi:hypothetical protein
MAVFHVEITLVASFPDGQIVSEDAFVGPVRAVAGGRVLRVESGHRKWQSGQVEFLNRNLEFYKDAAEPSVAFFEEIADTLAFIAGWVDERRSELEAVRRSGLKIFLLLDIFMDRDQMELTLPPVLLRACGEAQIPVQIVSND